ncbi:Male sterility, NAD-binding protein [Corchorus olitorius]|uniref:Fatty acyl-CoA reductase n=1 Tax=Corchorus olitorius TaxID=93759 RepID=A0A1R3HEJ1_9ROSI|nr:Male sterility, NAD-binding protein [Corchorus olitorius]
MEDFSAVKEKVLEARPGIEIDKSLQGKIILIIDATGFLGKAVLVEKFLRTVPNVLKAEIFKFVKEKYGEGYEAFMMSKLVPVVRNVSRSDLGMEQELANAIKKDVHIIVNSAAVTSFSPRSS